MTKEIYNTYVTAKTRSEAVIKATSEAAEWFEVDVSELDYEIYNTEVNKFYEVWSAIPVRNEIEASIGVWVKEESK